MKRILAIILAVCILTVLGAAALAADVYTVTFSNGTVYQLAAGEDLVFFIQCSPPGDLGSPDGSSASGEPASGEPAAPAPAAPPAAPAGPSSDAAWAAYQEYLIQMAADYGIAPNLDEFKAQVYAIGSWEEMDMTTPPWNLMFTTIGLSTWEAFQAGERNTPAVSGGPDATGEMGGASGEPEAAGAGITVSQGTVSYSHVTLGGPFSYPTSELVTVTGITGDITVTVTEAATAMDAVYAIYLDQAEIDAAIAAADAMASSASGDPSGEPSGQPSGEPSGEPSGGSAEADYEIVVNGQTFTAHYADVDNGDQATKSFEITVNGRVIPGAIDRGVWTAASGTPEDQAVVDAVQAAFEGR